MSDATATHVRRPARAAAVVVASLLLGGLTSWAQGVLPDAWQSFANSASGWTLLTAGLVWWARPPTVAAAVLGAVGFVGLVLGYTGASELRGLTYSPLLFGAVGLVVGPFVGVAAAWLRAHGWRAVAATALLAGIAVGECWYGLTVVAGSTSPVYWVTIGAVGLVLLATMLRLRARGLAPAAATLLGTAAVATAFVGGYGSLGGVPTP